MIYRYRLAVVDDIRESNLERALQARLLEIFGATMKTSASIFARAVTFDLADLPDLPAECANFTLALRRESTNPHPAWSATFEDGDKRMCVAGHIE